MPYIPKRARKGQKPKRPIRTYRTNYKQTQYIEISSHHRGLSLQEALNKNLNCNIDHIAIVVPLVYRSGSVGADRVNTMFVFSRRKIIQQVIPWLILFVNRHKPSILHSNS